MNQGTRRVGYRTFLALAGLVMLSAPGVAVAQPEPSSPPSPPIAPPAVLPVMPALPPYNPANPQAVSWVSSTPARVVDVRTLPAIPRPYPGPKYVVEHIIEGEKARMEEFEEHEGPEGRRAPGRIPAPWHPSIGPRGKPEAMFPGSDSQSSPFIPPDCTLAVGPTHVIMTANSLMSVWTREGTLVQEFSLMGSSGLFGNQNAGGFVFDPKCMFDSFENRYVVVALEYYPSPAFSSILIARSEPGDPLTWKTFRTEAKTNAPGGEQAWFDYPGFGYDQQAYYVSGNLFTFGDFGSFAGVKFRVINKQSLNGTVALFADIDDFTRTFGSVQATQHMGATTAPYFVSVGGTSTRTNLQIHAIKDPLTNPTRLMKVVQLLQSYDSPFFISACCEDATDPGCGAGFINTVDDRVFNASWRNGQLYMAHHFTLDLPDINSSAVTARWYQVATNNWPANTSNSPTYVQGGDIPGGVTPDGRPIHTFFPAIHVNSQGDVGVVLGTAIEGECAKVALSGRLVSDPPGTMSAPVEVKSSDGLDQDETRWGDYYGIAVDPMDDKTFWAIGQWNKQFSPGPGGNDGWSTWIFNFNLQSLPSINAVDDGYETAINTNAGLATPIDVMVNDYDSQNLTFQIDSFSATSAGGGSVTLSQGTGPDGRDELVYTSLPNFVGPDTFTYTLRNSANQFDSASVKVGVTTGDFRDPDDAGLTEPGIDVSYYIISPLLTDFPDTLPNSYLTTYVNNLNFPQADGVPFANSGRTSGTAGVFTGYINVPVLDHYDFCIRRGSGASLFIGDTLVVDDEGKHIPSDDPVCGSIGLKAGTHQFRVEFFHATGPHGLMMRATGGPLNDQILPDSWYLRKADCTGDFDNSGFVDTDDYDAFVFAFILGGEDADVNGSGFVDTDDFDYFVCAYESGCDCGR